MNKAQFLTRFERVKCICGGYGRDVVELGDFNYNDYRRAANGLISNEDRLMEIWKACETFAVNAIVGAMADRKVKSRVLESISQQDMLQSSAEVAL
jgi:hypothetical protein